MTHAKELAPKWLNLLRSIKIVFFDFDGVFTDNRVIVDEQGSEAVLCNRSDGVGIARLRSVGVESIIVSAETNPVVKARAGKLRVESVSGSTCKRATLTALLTERRVRPEEAAFVGNDLADIDAMRAVGVGIAVADAYPQVRQAARLMTTRMGGCGAVREVCDWIVEAKQPA